MRKFQQVFLILISLVFLGSCVSGRKIVRSIEDAPIIPPLKSGYSTALYKAEINIGENYFSGLFYFKSLGDSSYHFVLLSELGLNLMSLTFAHGEFELISCQDFLNKKYVLKMIKRDLRLLIDSPKMQSVEIRAFEDDKGRNILKIKDKHKSDAYFCAQDWKVLEIRNNHVFYGVHIVMPEYKTSVPEVITIQHKKIKLGIKLNLINIK